MPLLKRPAYLILYDRLYYTPRGYCLLSANLGNEMQILLSFASSFFGRITRQPYRLTLPILSCRTNTPLIVGSGLPILNRPLKQDLSHYESSTKAGPLSYSPAILAELQSTVFLCPTPQKVFVSVDVLLPYI